MYKNYNSLIYLFLGIILYNFIVVDTLLALVAIDEEYDSFLNTTPIELIISILIAPAVEEIIFRTHLSFRKKHLYGILLMIAACGFIFHELGILFTFLLITSFFTLVILYGRIHDSILMKYRKHIYIITSIIFCIFHSFHLAEYDFSEIEKFIILLIHYLPLSLYLGYVRREYGLKFSILFHSLNNLIILLGNTMITSF